MEWQPIETAPKDKAIWLTNGNGYGKSMLPCRWVESKNAWVFIYDNYSPQRGITFHPTDWMPLPIPPNK